MISSLFVNFPRKEVKRGKKENIGKRERKKEKGKKKSVVGKKKGKWEAKKEYFVVKTLESFSHWAWERRLLRSMEPLLCKQISHISVFDLW